MTELVALHGLNNTPQVWDRAIAELHRIAPDAARWHRPLLPPIDSVEQIAANLLDQLPPTFALAGFSFGGYVAAAMLQAAPQRIERIVFVCSSTRADSELQRATREKALVALREEPEATHEKLVLMQWPLVAHATRQDDASLRAIRDEMLVGYGPQRLAAHLKACIARPDRTQALAAFEKPRLMLAAADDKLITAELMADNAAHAPGTQFESIDTAGHLMPLERPDRLAQSLARWLRA